MSHVLLALALLGASAQLAHADHGDESMFSGCSNESESSGCSDPEPMSGCLADTGGDDQDTMSCAVRRDRSSSLPTLLILGAVAWRIGRRRRL